MYNNNNNNNNNNFVCKMLCMFISAATNDESVLFRASEGDSLFLFCKDLISSSLNATWSWRPHSSDQNSTLQPDSAGERLHFRNKDNDFSLTISKVDWGDSGRYECQRFSSSSQYKTFFEVVVVRVSHFLKMVYIFFFFCMNMRVSQNSLRHLAEALIQSDLQKCFWLNQRMYL
uniref:Ig-like domain-containing protein n=1 Tax=Pygocentrus nattereri TaxID=42514 RepID=A0AAR2K154_PYGNA